MNQLVKRTESGTGCSHKRFDLLTVLCAVFCVLLLTGCGSDSSSKRSTQINAPFANGKNGNGNGNGNGSAATLFAEDIRDSEARFQRLEQAVVGIKKDVEEINPAVQRLTRIESDLENVVTHLETILVQPEMLGIMPAPARQAVAPSAPQNIRPSAQASITQAPEPAPQAVQQNNQINIQPVPVTPQAQAQPQIQPSSQPMAITPQAAAQPAKAQTAQAGDIQGRAVRYGVHENYTRIVIEVSAPAKFSADLMDRANMLVIEIPDVVWTGANADTKRTSFINGWKAHPMEGRKGTILSFQLAKNSMVINQMTLQGPHRLVIDLANLDKVAGQ